jgi:hypothetical protein
MRSQQTGRRYLAGLVMAMAAVYLVAVGLSAAFAWPNTYHLWLIVNVFAFGLVPALAAFVLGRRAWSTKAASSVGFAAVALVILIFAFAVWQNFVISF